jgi:hypothetical protein
LFFVSVSSGLVISVGTFCGVLTLSTTFAAIDSRHQGKTLPFSLSR